MSWRVDIIGHNWLIRRKWQHLNPLNDQIRHKFNQIDPFLKFIVQGSQKKYVRVAISQKFDEVFFHFPTRIIAKLVIENTTVVALLEDFVCKPYLFSEVCQTWGSPLSRALYILFLNTTRLRFVSSSSG